MCRGETPEHGHVPSQCGQAVQSKAHKNKTYLIRAPSSLDSREVAALDVMEDDGQLENRFEFPVFRTTFFIT